MADGVGYTVQPETQERDAWLLVHSMPTRRSGVSGPRADGQA